jgi:fumarate hydratase class II
MTEKPTRVEKDSMGEMSLPASALHGASTHRAVLNFPVSGYRFSRPFIRALGLIKWAAAQANHDLGLLDAERAALIVQAAEEVAEGKLDDHFPLDIFQTGSGTSTKHQRERKSPIGARSSRASRSGRVSWFIPTTTSAWANRAMT